MAQSLAKVLVHIVFSTKGRMPLIAQDVRSDLSAYMAGILRQLGSAPVLVNCVADHVHILCGLPRTLALAKTIEEVKRGSSKWFKTKATALRNFHWQNGYGAFSVSPSAAAKVRAYIAGQEQRHRRVTFEEEFRALLERHEVAYDERYVWD